MEQKMIRQMADEVMMAELDCISTTCEICPFWVEGNGECMWDGEQTMVEAMAVMIMAEMPVIEDEDDRAEFVAGFPALIKYTDGMSDKQNDEVVEAVIQLVEDYVSR